MSRSAPPLLSRARFPPFIPQAFALATSQFRHCRRERGRPLMLLDYLIIYYLIQSRFQIIPCMASFLHGFQVNTGSFLDYSMCCSQDSVLASEACSSAPPKLEILTLAPRAAEWIIHSGSVNEHKITNLACLLQKSPYRIAPLFTNAHTHH